MHIPSASFVFIVTSYVLMTSGIEQLIVLPSGSSWFKIPYPSGGERLQAESTLMDDNQHGNTGDQLENIIPLVKKCRTKDFNSLYSFLEDGVNFRARQRPLDDYQYKGISIDPRDVITKDVSIVNTAQLHHSYWLEVVDPKHRYGHHLYRYYHFWETLGYPSYDPDSSSNTSASFFEWLDSSSGDRAIPELEDHPRSELDGKPVKYITEKNETDRYALTIRVDALGRGILYDAYGSKFCTACQGNKSQYMYVLRDGVLYGHKKSIIKKQSNTSENGYESYERFQHSTFFGGTAVTAAGVFETDTDGALVSISASSGHYQTTETEFLSFLSFLHGAAGVDLRTIKANVRHLKQRCFGKFHTKKLPASSHACYLYKCIRSNQTIQ